MLSFIEKKVAMSFYAVNRGWKFRERERGCVQTRLERSSNRMPLGECSGMGHFLFLFRADSSLIIVQSSAIECQINA